MSRRPSRVVPGSCESSPADLYCPADCQEAEKHVHELLRQEVGVACARRSGTVYVAILDRPGPASDLAFTASSPAKSSSTSDFDRVFHPFTIRDRVTVAPVNRFLHDGKKVDVKIDSVPELTKEGAFLSRSQCCATAD